MAEISNTTGPSRLQTVEDHLQNSGAAPSPPHTTNGTNGNNVNGPSHINSSGSTNGTMHQNGEFSIDDYRRMKVVCIGAGYSGIIAGIQYVSFIPLYLPFFFQSS